MELDKFFEDKHNQILGLALVFLFLFYFTLYFLRRASSSFNQLQVTIQTQMVSRVVSSIHSVVVTILAILILLFDAELDQNRLLYSSFQITLVLNIVIGYLLSDLIVMLLYREIFDWQFVLHHFISMTAFYTSNHGNAFPYIALFRLTSESSTLFINLRWIFLSFNMKNSKYYAYNGIIILIVFFAFRILTIPVLWFNLYNHFNDPIWSNLNIVYKTVCVACSIPLDSLNVFWYYKIVSSVRKHLANKEK